MKLLTQVACIFSVMLFTGALFGCSKQRLPQDLSSTSPSPQQGSLVIREFDCGSCHIIPGIREAHGLLGPPLIHFSRRGFIAGRVPNNNTNLVQWLVDPQSIDERTAMPQLGLDDNQARSIAAYLYTIE